MGECRRVLKTWYHMFDRCKSNKHSGESVCEEWKDFKTFEAWYEENYIEGWQLDKDLLDPTNKIYCPEFCRFVPAQLNSMKLDDVLTPKTLTKRDGKFDARVRLGGVQKSLGRFTRMEDAVFAYQKAKINYCYNALKKYAEMGVCKELVEAMQKRCVEYANVLSSGRA